MELVRFIGFQNPGGIRRAAGWHSFVLRGGTGSARESVNMEPGRRTPMQINAAMETGPDSAWSPVAMMQLTIERPIAFEGRHQKGSWFDWAVVKAGGWRRN